VLWMTLQNILTKTHIEASQRPTMLKVKVDEGGKWWSIGRERKDSKEKTKGKENKISNKHQMYVNFIHFSAV